MLYDIQQRFTPAILGEARGRFGFAPEPLQELEGSAFVYEGLIGGQPRILKIAPGIWNTAQQLTGSTLEQLLAEVDFVRYLAENELPVARPVPSRSGSWVERLPLDDQACFLAYAFEKAPGEMYPDADEVNFPPAVLVAWGCLCGHLHRLSAAYLPHPERRRLPWHANDLLDFPTLIPPEQTLVYLRRDELLTRLNALPQDTESYGLVHGDFHHGNFLVSGEKLTLFDFDAAEYFWYTGEICTALYNCLPLPRHATAKRRSYTLNYLHHFLCGYRQARQLSDFWLVQIPLFLKYCELLNYAYFHKYWGLSALTPRRAQVLADLRRRIEQEIPVVAFEPGDI
jgi:Ser/Thr protein kinase RdoA (MazF antagonist)